MKSTKKKVFFGLFILIIILFLFAVATVFFDQAILVRRHTFYHVNVPDKVVALTFDDGPSPKWTPLILEELEKAHVKATFFVLGEHVHKYPDIARRIVNEGHEIGNHSYTHRGLLLYKMSDIEKEIQDCEKIIKEATGITTRYFRPPKALLSEAEKEKINSLGYSVILWSLNSKDWVIFDDKYIFKYIVRNISPGDIILFHDSGGVFSVDGGDRHETVKTIPQLVKRLREQGYEFVTITELLARNRKNDPSK